LRTPAAFIKRSKNFDFMVAVLIFCVGAVVVHVGRVLLEEDGE
jgi:hypothetical protein